MVHPLQAASDGILQWADSVGGCFNPSKSCTMQFSPRSRSERAHPTHSTPHLRMQGDDVSDVTTHRHLGVILDCNLDFASHVATITTKFRQRDVLLIHMTKRIISAIASRLYTGYVRPVVECTSSLWQFQLTKSGTCDPAAVWRVTSSNWAESLTFSRISIGPASHGEDIFSAFLSSTTLAIARWRPWRT